MARDRSRSPDRKKGRSPSRSSSASSSSSSASRVPKKKHDRTRQKEPIQPEVSAIKGGDRSELTRYISDERVLNVLREKGIKSFFPVQYETFDYISAGDDLIARDRTGSGKTLAFSLPIIQRFRKERSFNGRVKFLIVLPTRELAIQVRNEIVSLRLKSGEDFNVLAVYGGSDIGDQIRRLRDGCDIVVSTPGRLIDLLERGALKLSYLQVTCLDQADEMLKQGFQEDIEKIFEHVKKSAPEKTQNLLFSATIPPWVIDLSKKYLSPSRRYVDLIKDTDIRTSKTVEHLALNSPYYHRNSIIADLVNLYGGRHGRTIIFCETKRQANEIQSKANLKQQTQVLHGDVPQKQREVIFQSFKEGKLKCLVATNVAARGLDIPEVDLILQLEPPKEVDAYIHRSGRTGRAGKSGVCVTFYTKAQQPQLQRIERIAKIKIRKIGPPQPADIIKSSARDIVISLNEVSDSVLTYFNQISEEMIDAVGSVKALSKALAFISGNTKKISQRSLLCSMEGYITYIVRCPQEFHANSFIFSFLRRHASEKVSECVKGLRKINKRCAVFDIPEDFRPDMERLIELIKAGSQAVAGFECDVVTSMDMLEDDDDQRPGPDDDQDDDQIQRLTREAYRNKANWEIFIGSLPNNADERELGAFFKERKIKIANIRILRSNFKSIQMNKASRNVLDSVYA